MGKYYCEYCGASYADVRALTTFTCQRHPDGQYKGRHKLYEGSEKSQYTCKYCGQKFPDIRTLTTFNCQRHPNGQYKGKHAPAL